MADILDSANSTSNDPTATPATGQDPQAPIAPTDAPSIQQYVEDLEKTNPALDGVAEKVNPPDVLSVDPQAAPVFDPGSIVVPPADPVSEPPDAPVADPPPPPAEKPKKSGAPKGLVVGLVAMFFLLTTGLVFVFVNQQQSLNDIRNRAEDGLYPQYLPLEPDGSCPEGYSFYALNESTDVCKINSANGTPLGGLGAGCSNNTDCDSGKCGNAAGVTTIKICLPSPQPTCDSGDEYSEKAKKCIKPIGDCDENTSGVAASIGVCCVPPGGTSYNDGSGNYNPVTEPVGSPFAGTHWTTCATGYTCRQNEGCFSTGGGTPPPGGGTNPPGEENTPTPTQGNTPTPTGISAQCDDIKVYKNGAVVVPSTLTAGDAVTIAVAGGNATKARIRVNGSAWSETSTKNASGEYTLSYTIPTGITNFTIESEIFGLDGVWH